MAEAKPLRLKTQRVPRKIAIAVDSPIAQVCVDTGIFHLGDIYDYLIPEEFTSLIAPGVFVNVPFGAKQAIGYVVSRNSTNYDQSKMKPITKVVSPIPLLSEELLEIIMDTLTSGNFPRTYNNPLNVGLVPKAHSISRTWSH